MKLYEGIIPPVVTPLLAQDQLDIDGFERLIERGIDGGVAGFFVLGTTGEAVNLSSAMRREVVRASAKIINGRKPLLVGITDCSVDDAASLAEEAAGAGAKAVVFAAPFYFPLSQAELVRYALVLADRLPLPFFLYNIPSHTRNSFDRESVKAISAHPKFLGIKDSTGDFNYLQGLVSDYAGRPDCSVLVGPEEMMVQCVLAGADGGVCGGANLWPALYVKACQAAKAGNLALAREHQAKIQQLSDSIYRIAGYLRGMKCALELAGVCSGAMTEPFAPLQGEQREQVRAGLISLGLI
jgi:4-hydroxy-tetrahydrodipicolinate synthase